MRLITHPLARCCELHNTSKERSSLPTQFDAPLHPGSGTKSQEPKVNTMRTLFVLGKQGPEIMRPNG